MLVMTRNPKISLADLPRLMQKRSLVLVGHMGAGKSTIGKYLAKQCDLSFIDIDREIEKTARMTITEIFDRFGEKKFRTAEQRIIARILSRPQAIIATGGGAFMTKETRSLILDKAIAVWLDADIDTLIKRTKNHNNRPLLRGQDAKTLFGKLAAERNPIYAKAHLHIESESMSRALVAETIMTEMQKWIESQ